MAKEVIIRQSTVDYNVAVQAIKEAILRSQYQAAKLVNREMLSLYYGIGGYISANSRKGFWDTGAIGTISERLRKELPGLKGFSESNLKNMRMFYEEWAPVLGSSDSISSISPIMIGEIETTLLHSSKSTIGSCSAKFIWHCRSLSLSLWPRITGVDKFGMFATTPYCQTKKMLNQ